ncbi:MAG: polysaccharide biosynthesis/export family protein [Gemmatimonadaceae bacterium]
MLRILWLVLVAAGLHGAVDLHAQTAPPGDPGQALNPGDQIRITVWRNPEFTGDFMVAGNGTITHPLYREIQVTGMPISAVEDRLRTFLTRYIANPQFVILPLVKIIVGGEVRSPNILSVPPETTIAQAIVLAGGPTERGRLDRIRVIRDGREIQVDLARADSDVAMLQIRSGDQIFVARRTNLYRDVIGPTFSGIAAVAALVSIFAR